MPPCTSVMVSRLTGRPWAWRRSTRNARTEWPRGPQGTRGEDRGRVQKMASDPTRMCAAPLALYRWVKTTRYPASKKLISGCKRFQIASENDETFGLLSGVRGAAAPGQWV